MMRDIVEAEAAEAQAIKERAEQAAAKEAAAKMAAEAAAKLKADEEGKLEADRRAAEAQAQAEASAKAKAADEAKTATDEEARAAALRFNHILNEDFQRAGFDPERFNVVVLGTNNTGKSSAINTLFSGDVFRRETFLGKAMERMDDCKLEDEEREEAKAQIKDLQRGFEEGDGSCTSWDMLKEGKSSKKIDVWFPSASIFDLPGIELADGGVEAYARRGSLNHFDAAIIVVEKALSTDDFTLLLHLQKAPAGGVPFFIIRAKTDLAVQSRFRSHIDKKLPRANFELAWPELVEQNLQMLLGDLPAANREIGHGNPMMMMSEEHLCQPSQVVFMGFVEPLATAKYNGNTVPFQVVEQAARIFEAESRYLRRELLKLARHKTKIPALPCLHIELERTILDSGLPYEVPDDEDVVVDIIAELDGDFFLGFDVKLERKDLVIVKPGKGEDKRSFYGIQDGDTLREFPLGQPVGSKDTNLKTLMSKRNVEPDFQIVVNRMKGDPEEPTFAQSVFKTLYTPTYREISLADYKASVQRIVFDHAKQFSIMPKNIRQFLQKLDDERGYKEPDGWKPITNVQEMAVSDWTSAQVISNSGRPGEVEFCSMINAKLRDDKLPAINDVAAFMVAIRFSLVSTRGPTPPLRPEPLPDDGLIRGLAMPAWVVIGKKEDDVEPFFQVGKTYRNPQFMATTTRENSKLADHFSWRAMNKDPTLLWVRFEIDVSSGPLHVNRIANKLGEVEFLWAPYSCFKVMEVDISEMNEILAGNKPVVIKVLAFHDNKSQPGETADSEYWPLAPWH